MTSDINIALYPDFDASAINAGISDLWALEEVLKNVLVTGATISYGINKVPIAHVYISSVGYNQEAGLNVLCDFDFFRRCPVILVIKTKTDCLRFKGIIDGHSISQSPGNLTASFVIKHNFTLLTEVYPRLIGGNASTSNKFAMPQGIKVEPSIASNPYLNSGVSGVVAEYAFYAAFTQIYNQDFKFDQLAIRFLISLLQILVRSQSKWNDQLEGTTESQYGNFLQLKCALSLNAQSMYEPVMNLISTIDPSFTDGFQVHATDALIGIHIQNNIALLEDTMFTGFVRMLEEYGCLLVVANNRAYVLPEAPYLKPIGLSIMPGIGMVNSINPNKAARVPNVAFPGDYESFSFNDVGENTVKGVFVIAESMGNNTDWTTRGGASGINGIYTEDLNLEPCKLNPPPSTSTGHSPINQNRVFGNIEVKTIPGLATSFMTATLYHKTSALKNKIEDGSVKPDNQDSTLAAINRVTSAKAALDVKLGTEADKDYIQKMTEYLHQQAEIEYCRIKYGDRTGNITMPFNNNWAPGASGSLYTRTPGFRIDFFVTDVTHNFTISAPNSANASTSVSFRGGRAGASINTGLDRVTLYDYDYTLSQKFCSAFLTDLSNDVGAPIPPEPTR